MRTISPALQAHLEGELLTLALLVKIVRTDTVTLGFTDHDEALVFGGVTYEALSSVQVSALQQQLGGGVDNLDVVGILTSDAITETDLLAGRYDNAEITMMVVNWASLGDGAVVLLRGSLGDVTLTDGQYKVTIRSLSQRLQQQVGELFSRTCRARQFGAPPCAPGGFFQDGKTLADYQFSRTIASQVDDDTLRIAGDTSPTDTYTYGKVIATSGDNAGLQKEVKSHIYSGGVCEVVLQEAFPFAFAPGDAVTMEVGCQRRFTEDCVTRFGNWYNFQGEPDIPGTQVLLQRGRGTG
jgi:uncharacterized phage protein (TIGR02218 family)